MMTTRSATACRIWVVSGGGSPTGGLVYREAAWPEEYHGNLFFCEWADRALRRFRVEPRGATFDVVLDEDFATPGPGVELRVDW